MLQRLIFSFVLIATFALGQTGAVLHEISHIADLTSQSQQPDKAPHSPLCDKCLSYGELAHALNASHTLSLPPAASHALFTQADYAYFHQVSLLYAARAPPTHLI